jgi:RNA polymerase sigma-70 factor (ECF subfamily)
MEDKCIIDLLFKRDEQGLEEARQRYGSLIKTIIRNLLTLPEDAEECENDTYHALWNTIPPQKPHSLSAYMGRLARNIAVSRYRKNTAEKRSEAMTLMLSELSECLPAPATTESEAEGRELTRLIADWLKTLEEDDRIMFVRRYWYGYSLREIAEQTFSAAPYLATRMHNLRRSLKAWLEQSGVAV